MKAVTVDRTVGPHVFMRDGHQERKPACGELQKSWRPDLVRMHTCGVGVRQVVVANCLPSSYGMGSKIQLCLLTKTTGRAACGALLFSLLHFAVMGQSADVAR